jgi:hypothetical protein
MRRPVEIENIEEMRQREGIDDVELREEVRGLQIGDFVRLTLVTGDRPFARDTVLVRVTRIEGRTYHGRLAERPAAQGLSGFGPGSPLTFSRVHIHSIRKRQATHED